MAIIIKKVETLFSYHFMDLSWTHELTRIAQNKMHTAKHVAYGSVGENEDVCDRLELSAMNSPCQL